MSVPPTDPDRTPPVLLREPRPEPAESPSDGLHPGWTAFLAEGELPLWHGRATIRRPALWSRATGRALLPAIIAIGLVAWLIGLLPAAFLAVYVLLMTIAGQGEWGLHPPSDWSYYLLTGQAAYVARATAHELQLVRRIPVDKSLSIVLGATNVRLRPGEGGWRHRWFSPRNQFYERFDDGFFGIPDAENVYEIIRAIQKGQP